jgi:hypothetical protein
VDLETVYGATEVMLCHKTDCADNVSARGGEVPFQRNKCCSADFQE